VAAGLRENAFAGIDQDDRDIGGGRARHHIAGVLFVARRVGDDELTYKNTFLPERMVEPETDDCLIWSRSEEAWPFSTAAKPCPRGHTPQWPGWGGGQMLMNVLSARVQSLGVSVRYDTRALALVVDDTGAVCGVVLRSFGQDAYVRARCAVILCAGGFAMNRDMVRRHAPTLLRSADPIGNPGDDGSGILMGVSVGAAAIHMDQGFVSLPFYAPESLIKGIFVNERGQRFINEDCYHGRTGYHALQQGGERWTTRFIRSRLPSHESAWRRPAKPGTRSSRNYSCLRAR
jgi:3-oxo-5alpha-steroid 4-dehydrogenase